MMDQLKIRNLTNILVCLFSQRTATKAELVQLTGLSNSTVSSSVNSLLKLELVTSVGMEDSGGGRRSTIYGLNKEYGQFVGIDMRGKQIVLSVTDCENTVLEKNVFEINPEILAIDCLTSVIEKTMARFPHVLGIGIGLDAELDHDEQVVRACEEYNWHHVPLKEILERQFMIFTYFDHRVNGAAVREGLLGRARGINNYLCYYESVDSKTAVVLDGEICRGDRNYTGRISDKYELAQNADLLIKFLDISKLLIGYNTDEYRVYLQRHPPSALKGEVVIFSEVEETVAVGMAAIAQKEWFQSIYFML